MVVDWPVIVVLLTEIEVFKVQVAVGRITEALPNELVDKVQEASAR